MKISPDLIEAKERHRLIEKDDSGFVESIPDISAETFLLFAKAESRFNKGQEFNGYVLHQKSTEENEFIQFLGFIKENLSEFPKNTRIHLAVYTSYVDKHEQEILREQKIKMPSEIGHWTAVDVLIDNGQIKTFVLDAANAIGYKGICAELKINFPAGRHYAFTADTIPHPHNPSKEKLRAIQSDDENCGVFTVEHIRQLSQIDSERIYGELAEIATEEGAIYPENMKYGYTLNRIFRATQSWETLNSLPSVLSTLFKGNKTVGESATENSEFNNHHKKINKTITNKRYKHFEGITSYANSLEVDIQPIILEHRKGFAFVKNTILFKIHNQLTTLPVPVFLELVEIFSENFKIHFPIGLVREYKEINNFLIKISHLPSKENTGAARNEFIVRIASLFNYFEANENIDFKNNLKITIAKSLGQLKVENLLSQYSEQIDSISKDAEVSSHEKRLIVVKLGKRIKKNLKQELLQFFGNPVAITVDYGHFFSLYKSAKQRIRIIQKSAIAKIDEFRITSVEDLLKQQPVLASPPSIKIKSRNWSAFSYASIEERVKILDDSFTFQGLT